MQSCRSGTSRLRRIATVVACVATLAACARVHYETDATAPNPDPDRGDTGTEPEATSDSGPQPSFAGAGPATSTVGSAPASPLTERVTPGCRGSGFFGYSERSPPEPCCAGFHEYLVPSPALNASMQRFCGPDYDAYTCIRGQCGDGVCEVAESAACGCLVDCPAAAWAGTVPEVNPNETNGFSEPPASCDKRDILTGLQRSESIDCGDLAYEASSAQTTAAIRCVRDAYDTSKPFHVFWQTRLGDRRTTHGLVARTEAWRLEVFDLEIYDLDARGLARDGASATWRRASLQIDPKQSTSFETCVETTWLDRTHCDCLPEGKRLDAPDGSKVELRCQSD